MGVLIFVKVIAFDGSTDKQHILVTLAWYCNIFYYLKILSLENKITIMKYTKIDLILKISIKNL